MKTRMLHIALLVAGGTAATTELRAQPLDQSSPVEKALVPTHTSEASAVKPPRPVPSATKPEAKKEKSNKVPKNKELMAEGEHKKASLHPADTESVAWKPGTGLTVKSKDGLFALATRVRVQIRGEVANESGSPAEMGIILRRARLQFKGHSFGKHNKFKAEFAFSPKDLRLKEIDGNNIPRETPLLTWYMEFDQNPNATFRIGQYKIPFSRQRVISSGNQQMVDRSIANGEFNLDRDIGLDVRSKDLFDLGHLRYYAGIYNGEGRSAFGFGNSDLMYLARLEYLPFGIFKDYSESDFERLSRPGLSIGASYSYAPNAGGTKVNRNGAPADGGTTDIHSANVDVTFKYQGFSASSEFHYRDGERNVDEGDPNFEEARNGMGWFAQAGYLLPRTKFEVAGRFGQVIAADDSTLGDKNEAGLAFSYYPGQHPFKIQADVFQLWGDEDLGDGETRARVQMQYSF